MWLINFPAKNLYLSSRHIFLRWTLKIKDRRFEYKYRWYWLSIGTPYCISEVNIASTSNNQHEHAHRRTRRCRWRWRWPWPWWMMDAPITLPCITIIIISPTNSYLVCPWRLVIYYRIHIYRCQPRPSVSLARERYCELPHPAGHLRFPSSHCSTLTYK